MSRSNRKKDCVAVGDAQSSIHYATILTPEEAVTMIQAVGRLYQALSSGSLS